MGDSAAPPAGKARVPGRRAASRRRGVPPPIATANALFLDVDGTLLHFADTPGQVRVGAAMQALLPALLGKLGGALALITGRTIADADRLFGGRVVTVAGQHGCERRDADGVVHEHPAQLPGLAWLRRELEAFARSCPGVVFEDKGRTLALHYRQAPAFASLVHGTLRGLLAATPDGAWTLQRGKLVAELRPDGRDKGTAILEYLEEPPFSGRVPVFVGDDHTDEFGFAAVASRGGWAVKVGRGPTTAGYRLPDVGAVREWLQVSAGAVGRLPGPG